MNVKQLFLISVQMPVEYNTVVLVGYVIKIS